MAKDYCLYYTKWYISPCPVKSDDGGIKKNKNKSCLEKGGDSFVCQWHHATANQKPTGSAVSNIFNLTSNQMSASEFPKALLSQHVVEIFPIPQFSYGND